MRTTQQWLFKSVLPPPLDVGLSPMEREDMHLKNVK